MEFENLAVQKFYDRIIKPKDKSKCKATFEVISKKKYDELQQDFIYNHWDSEGYAYGIKTYINNPSIRLVHYLVHLKETNATS